MPNNGKHFEVRSPEGTLMFSVHVVEQSAVPTNARQGNGSGARNSSTEARKRRSPEARHDAGNDQDASTMTENQRRYLFRIMADRGVEGDAAHEQLKQLFGVDSLNSVGKQEASSMIGSLLQEAEPKY